MLCPTQNYQRTEQHSPPSTQPRQKAGRIKGQDGEERARNGCAEGQNSYNYACGITTSRLGPSTSNANGTSSDSQTTSGHGSRTNSKEGSHESRPDEPRTQRQTKRRSKEQGNGIEKGGAETAPWVPEKEPYPCQQPGWYSGWGSWLRSMLTNAL